MNSIGNVKISLFIGRVGEDIIEGSSDIKIIINQLMPALEGSVSASDISLTVETTNDFNIKESSNVKVANYITASWMAHDYQKYPPTVRVGEQVRVYQFGDTDKYFWESMGRNSELRKNDVLRFEVSDKTNLNETLNNDNTYFFELNTKEKTVILATSTSDKEKAKYILKMDGKKGALNITDDHGNYITIDSDGADSVVTAANAAGSASVLTGKNVRLNAPGTLVLKAGDQIVFDTPILTCTTANKGSVTKLNAGSLSIECSNFATVNAPVIGFNGEVVVGGLLKSSTGVVAPFYSTGGAGSVSQATTNIASASSISPPNKPEPFTENPNIRHAAAHEQMIELAAAIESILMSHGASVSAGQLTSIAASSKMPMNKGN